MQRQIFKDVSWAAAESTPRWISLNLMQEEGRRAMIASKLMALFFG
jgi:hypothetical protein